MSAGDVSALIAQLRDCLVNRRLSAGMSALDAHRPLLLSIEPAQRNAGVLAGMVAQWVDAGYGDPALVNEMLGLFPRAARASMPLLDYLHLRMAEGLAAMKEEEFEQAMRHFRFVQSLEGEVGDTELMATSFYWTGRCLRRAGRYDDALVCTARGKRLALQRGYSRMAAAMEILESWLVFQKGRLKEAAAILQAAEESLRDTDDHLSRGNIQSAYGRIARRQGRYDQALEYFERAIAEYRQHDPRHTHLARTLVNMALVKRIIARLAHKSIDEEAERRRTAGPARERPAEELRATRGRIESLRAEARTQLAEALAIYTDEHNHRGIGSVNINAALLDLDSGDIERAAGGAAEAFRHGDEKRDYILMARARTLQCVVENARVEEEIGEDPAALAHQALEYAHEAVEMARHTQNRRLLARAYVWEGLTLSNAHFQDADGARRCCDQATALMKPEGQEREYPWEELELLRSRVLRTGPIDEALREWSHGNVGEKTFQQITEEFAAIIIPKVWEREDRRISRVAARLSISPKKVRRILYAAGLLGGKAHRATT